jgi:hypothetical protein
MDLFEALASQIVKKLFKYERRIIVSIYQREVNGFKFFQITGKAEIGHIG